MNPYFLFDILYANDCIIIRDISGDFALKRKFHMYFNDEYDFFYDYCANDCLRNHKGEMMKKRVLSMFLILTMILSSIVPAYGTEYSPASMDIRGLNGNWDAGTYPMTQIAANIWQGSFELDHTIEQSYKGVLTENGQDSWFNYRVDGEANIPISIDETQVVTFTYYKEYGILLDSVNYPNGLEIKMAGSKDELGPWSPLGSQIALTPVSTNLYKANLQMSPDESFEYKFIFNPTEAFEWAETSTGDNIPFTNGAEAQSVDFYINLSNKVHFTSLDLVKPLSNFESGSTVQVTDSLQISGANSTLRYEMTTDGSAPSLPSVQSSSFQGLSFSELGGNTVKINLAYEKEGLIGETLSLELHVEEATSESLFVTDQVFDEASETVTFSFNKSIESIDESKISILPETEFTSRVDGSDLIISFKMAMYTDYTLSLEAGTALVGDLLSDASEATFKTSLKSPIVNEGQVTFNALHDGETLNVVGSLNGWDNTGLAMTKVVAGYFTLTQDLEPGSYEYKYFPVSGSWDNGFTDQLNPLSNDGNSLVHVDGLSPNISNELQQGHSLTLETTLIDKNGTSSQVSPTYQLKEAYDGISIVNDQLISAEASYTGPVVILVDYLDYSEEVTVQVVGTLNTFIIHYHKYDGNYTNRDLWAWFDNQDGQGVPFTADVDGFKQATIQTTQNHVNIIPRVNDWSSQESTFRVEGTGVTSVWILEGDDTLYTSRDQITLGKTVLHATFDENKTVNVLISHASEDLTNENFNLYDGDTIIPTELTTVSDTQFSLTTNEAIDVRKIYTVKGTAYQESEVQMRRILDDPMYFYSGNDLGLTYSASASTFKVWAPTASQVSVMVYEDAGVYVDGRVADHTSGTPYLMSRQSNGVWSESISGDLDGQFYMYKVEFADGTINYAIDPYVKATSANGQRGAIINLENTDPAGWSEEKPFLLDMSDVILYELHVRDFSIDEDSGMVNKGKYLAFTEMNTSYNGYETGMSHLTDLGVTHVHLLPVFDFKTVDETLVDDPNASEAKFNWGYDPQNYNVPEGSYSTNPMDPESRITEFKAMVQSMHDNDLRVVMDVVYNHTFNVEDGPFDKIVPSYYYRTNERGTFTNGSGCGNEVASERPMVRKFIKDSVKYWAEEYNVDGFRFDLMGLIDLQTMEEITYEVKQEIDPSIIIYGEPWTAGSHAIYNGTSTVKGTQKDKDFAVFNDNFRNAIKGGSDDDTTGFATGDLSNLGSVVAGIYAGTDFTNAPAEAIQYVTAHDNLVLWDKILKTQGLDASTPYGHITEENIFDNELVKRDLLANGLILTSQGVPFIHAGSEMLRSKYGDHNSYKSSDDINKIDWSNLEEFDAIREYYAGLIELRKSHPAFTMEVHQEIWDALETYKQEDGLIAYTLKDYANGDTWKNIVVILNGNEEIQTVSLPSDTTWHIVVDNDEAGTQILDTVEGNQVMVAGLSMMVLYDEASNYVPQASDIKTSQEIYYLQEDELVDLQAYVVDQMDQPMIGLEIGYSVSDDTIISVENGKIKALSLGDASVTLTAGALEKVIPVHVVNKVLTRIELSGSDQVYASKSSQLNAICYDQNDQVMRNQTIEWTSLDDSIASVHDGLVTGHNPGQVTITANIGEIKAQHVISVEAYETRMVNIFYLRDDETYDNWSMWVWNTGESDGAIEPVGTKTMDGRSYLEFQVEVSPESQSFGMIIRLGNWEAKDPDYDRFIEVPAGVDYLKVISYSGQGDFKIYKAITGPVIESGHASFFYRDHDLFRAGQMTDIDSVKLLIDNMSYDMVYDASQEMYTYVLENISEGDHLYQYEITIDGQTTIINDPYNQETKDNKSLIVYHLPDITVDVTVNKDQVKLYESTVLKVELENEEDVAISNIEADLSQVSELEFVAIDIINKAITFAPTKSGTHDIKVIVTDEYGNKHEGLVSVIVSDEAADQTWDESIIYFMVTDRFNDGDTSNNYNVNKDHPEAYHGGDFQGIIDKLDYLDNLGVNTIWITPIVDNIDFNQGKAFDGIQYGYHGYWAKDFTTLDEHLGDLDTFKTLIDKAHDLDIKIMVDVVLNHTGYGMDQASTLDTRDLPTEAERAVFENMLRENPGDDALTGSLAGLPDFKTEEEAVREQLITWQTDWLNKARTDRGDTIDFFRVDTVKHVEHGTWQAFKNQLVQMDQDFRMIGEYYDGSLDNTGDYLASDQMDSLLDFNFKWKAKLFVEGQIELIESELVDRNQELNGQTTLGQFLSSHDEDGFLTRFNVSDDQLTDYAMLAASLQTTSKGQVVVYYGEEIGLTGKNAGDMSQGQYSENRYDMIFDQNHEDFNASIYNHYVKMLNIRNDYSELLSKGNRSTIEASDSEGYTVFKRVYDDQEAIITIHITNNEQSVTIDTGHPENTYYVDVYSGNTYVVDDNGQVNLSLEKASQGGTSVLIKQETLGNTIHHINPVSGIQVSYNTQEKSAIKKLPQTTLVRDVMGNTVSVDLTWSISNYNRHVPGLYTAVATFELPETMVQSQPETRLQITTDVELKEAPRAVGTPVKVSLNATYLALEVGSQAEDQSFDLDAVITGTNDLKVTWTSSNPEVATVDENGVVTAVGIGETIIEVTSNTLNRKAYCTVEVFLVGDEIIPLGDVNTKLPYMGGYPDGKFMPDKAITRAEVATVFSKILPNAAGENVILKDVSCDHWAYDAIQSVMKNGLFSGYNDGSFKPDAPITRAEIAAVISNYWKRIGHKQTAGEVETKDVKNHWASDAIYKLYQAKLVSGYPDGTFRPDNSTKRAEFVVIMNKLLGRRTKEAQLDKFSDVKGHWAKNEIMTATELAD